MKRTLFAVLLLLPLVGWGAGSREQPHDRPRPDGQQRFARLIETLSLTETQQPSVRQTFAEHHALMRELGHSDAAQRQQLDAQLDKELAALLTSDQLQRWVAFKAQRPPRGDKRGPHHDGRGPPPQR